MTQTNRTVGDWLWLVGVVLVSSGVCWSISTQTGATFDEPFYVRAGLTAWRTGSNKLLMRAGTMTLPVDVQTLPLYLWERWRGSEWLLPDDIPQLLPMARATNLFFWIILLTMVWQLGWWWGGRWGARLAILFVASEPNLLAHAALATTDIALVACLLVLVATLERGQGRNWPHRWLLPGLAFGLALTAKASALVFGLEAMLVYGLWHSVQRLGGTFPFLPGWTPRFHSPWTGWIQLGRHWWQQTSSLRRDIACMTIIGLIVAFAYTGCDWGPEPTFIRWAEQLPEGPIKQFMLPISQHVTIFTNAGEALLYQIKHNIRGHGTYLLGQWYPRATPLYFPIALSMKTPVSILGLVVLAAWVAPRKWFLAPPTLLAGLILLLSPTYRVQIGIRFLFPAMVLLVTSAAAALGHHLTDSQRPCSGDSGTPPAKGHLKRRRFLAAILFGLLAGQTVAVWWHWPDLLTYFNAVWGGPHAGDHLLHESNYDWGQGLPELRRWCYQQGVDRIAVWYYGMDPTVDTPPFQRALLSHQPHGGDPQRIQALCGSARLLAVSVGCLRCNPDITPHHRQALDWLHQQTPIARTRLFLIYPLDPLSSTHPNTPVQSLPGY